MSRTREFYKYSGEIRMPRDADDETYFASGQRAFHEDNAFNAPFPGADTWADMMTNQGWVFESRGLTR